MVKSIFECDFLKPDEEQKINSACVAFVRSMGQILKLFEKGTDRSFFTNQNLAHNFCRTNFDSENLHVLMFLVPRFAGSMIPRVLNAAGGRILRSQTDPSPIASRDNTSREAIAAIFSANLPQCISMPSTTDVPFYVEIV